MVRSITLNRKFRHRKLAIDIRRVPDGRLVIPTLLIVSNPGVSDVPRFLAQNKGAKQEAKNKREGGMEMRRLS